MTDSSNSLSRKLRIAAAAVAALVAALIGPVVASYTATSPGAATGPSRITIDYWEKWTGMEADAMRAVVDDFNASQDRITVRMLSVSQIDQKLMLAISAGRPPDVAGLWSYSVNVYADKSALVPLDHMLSTAGVTRADYVPAFWNLCTHRGLTWALPSTPATMALHWNKQLFREAGLDPDKPPTSIAELDAMAEHLTIVQVNRSGQSQRIRFGQLTDAERSTHAFEIIQLGFSPGVPGWWNPLWGYWFGGQLWDGDKTITTDSPENLAAFTWFGSYTSRYGLDNLRKFSSSFGNFASPQDPFLSGRVAMVLQGLWLQNFIVKYAPALDWDAAAFPSVDPVKLPNVALVETDVLVIPRGATHPRESFEFIRYVNRQGEMEKLVLGQRKISPLAKVSDTFYARHSNPRAKLYYDLASSPHAFAVPRCPVWMEYSDEMVAAADRIGSLLQSPADALAQVRERVQWRMDRSTRRWDAVGSQRVEQWQQILHEQQASETKTTP